MGDVIPLNPDKPRPATCEHFEPPAGFAVGFETVTVDEGGRLSYRLRLREWHCRKCKRTVEVNFDPQEVS